MISGMPRHVGFRDRPVLSRCPPRGGSGWSRRLPSPVRLPCLPQAPAAAQVHIQVHSVAFLQRVASQMLKEVDCLASVFERVNVTVLDRGRRNPSSRWGLRRFGSSDHRCQAFSTRSIRARSSVPGVPHQEHPRTHKVQRALKFSRRARTSRDSATFAAQKAGTKIGGEEEPFHHREHRVHRGQGTVNLVTAS
jgi:hypothetical protein